MAEDKDSEKSIVQFNVVNTTGSAISVDLFDLATLNTTPTQPNYINPPNSVVQTFGAGIYASGVVSNNGNLYVVDSTSFSIEVYDTNYNLIATPSIFPTSIISIVYNSNQNQLYVYGVTGRLFVLDCNTNTFTINIVTPYTPLIGVYNSVSNTIYYYNITTSNILIFDCNSLTFILALSLPVPFLGVDNMLYNPSNNYIYFTDNTNVLIGILDCNSNTYLSSITKTFAGGRLTLNQVANNIYISFSNDVYFFNYNTNIFTGVLNLPFNITSNGAVNNLLNELYYNDFSGNLIKISTLNNSLISSDNLGYGALGLCFFNPINNDIVVNNSSFLIEYTTLGITTAPYYVTGAINYNYFVQNLQNEPVIVSKIRAISPQTQLDNVANILTIDSSGQQHQYPVIPLLTVSAWQEQGNISELKFKGLVFDGRTYISNYTINANTTVILEIHYEQLDNTKIRYLGKMLPKKVPLKDVFDEYVDLSM